MNKYFYYKCPTCFFNWYEHLEEDDDDEDSIRVDEIRVCEFCEKNPTSLQILERQLDIMDKMHMSDFPKVFRRFFNHMQLKDA